MEALEISHRWAGGLGVPATYVLTGEDLRRKRSKKKSLAVVGLCCGEVRPGCSPSAPLCPLNEETRSQPGLRQGKVLVLLGSQIGQGAGGTSRK